MAVLELKPQKNLDSPLNQCENLIMFHFTHTIPLSLYIHLPWCVRKCPYCDFNSHEAHHAIPETEYIAALMRDLDGQLPAISDRPIISIFFGGGTPSLFSPESIEKILQEVRKRLTLSPDCEITLEANPGTVDEARFKGFYHAGINRLSIGVQSLQDDKLKSLGRIHNRDYALTAIENAKKAGFINFNVDLMHGLPNQSVDDALSDLQEALRFNPPHLSWYQLTIEPNTVFYRQSPVLPHEDTLEEIQLQGKKYLLEQGLKQYEVSAYAKPDSQCQHNLNYWEFGDYLGIGAGSHSKLTDFKQQLIIRTTQPRQPKDYLQLNKKPTASTSLVSHADATFEFMLNALRLTQGVPLSLYTERTGLPAENLTPLLQQAIQKGLLINDQRTLCATELGQRFLNDLIKLFMP